jgi:multidrug transporter EmrE-like cation transporter
MKSFRIYLSSCGKSDREDGETKGLKVVKMLALAAIAAAHLWFVVDGLAASQAYFIWRPFGAVGRATKPIVRSVSPKSYWAALGFHSIVLVGTGAWAGVTLVQICRR